MTALTHAFDLAGMRLRPGEGRRLQLSVPLGEVTLGAESYRPQPSPADVRLEVSRMAGQGYALRLAFAVRLTGPCMRCLGPAGPEIEVRAREVDVPGSGEDLDSPYVQGDTVDLAAWARDALVLAVPVTVLCREDCKGLCPVCAADLNVLGDAHVHEREPDPRWAKLSELELE